MKPIFNISVQEATDLYNNKFWLTMSDYEIAKFQLLTDRLCMPFDVFHLAVERSLKRPVYTHEFGLNHEGLVRELLEGTPSPTLNDIINLIPKDKLILVIKTEP